MQTVSKVCSQVTSLFQSFVDRLSTSLRHVAANMFHNKVKCVSGNIWYVFMFYCESNVGVGAFKLLNIQWHTYIIISLTLYYDFIFFNAENLYYQMYLIYLQWLSDGTFLILPSSEYVSFIFICLVLPKVCFLDKTPTPSQIPKHIFKSGPLKANFMKPISFSHCQWT